mgnify:CR=1 FL=1
MRTDLLTTFKKAINGIKNIERYLEKASEKSFVKYSMLKDVLKEAKTLREKMVETHENIGEINETYIIKGIEFEYEVRSFYQNKIKYYRWLLDL